jgi:ABC-2 type transport system ATP-binding protein
MVSRKRRRIGEKMSNLILETKNLTKRYKKLVVVENLSLSIEKNSIYGLLGPNGAGKSTTLKMITGMIQPSSGEVFFEGKPWVRDHLIDMGALIESPPLYDNLTAIENLMVRTTVLGLPKDRIEEVLDIVDLKNTGNKRAGQFSMGMKQRLGIAIALLSHPKLLILDEPTNGLDPFGIQELRELIRSFPQKGITVILSSHILSEIEQVADYIGIISGGRLGYEGIMKQGDNLEQLFMDVAGKYRREEI